MRCEGADAGVRCEGADAGVRCEGADAGVRQHECRGAACSGTPGCTPLALAKSMPQQLAPLRHDCDSIVVHMMTAVLLNWSTPSVTVRSVRT